MFQINEVVEFENELYRILALLLEEVVWIPVSKEGVSPSFVPTESLVNAVENGILVRKPDPSAYLIYEMQKLEKTSSWSTLSFATQVAFCPRLVRPESPKSWQNIQRPNRHPTV